ncbi:MFS transporter [Streptomyces sp. URMC 125]|uniref:MFS transporter n=1 Tax=Streptomyces sp. URMC 125 TaxID=3423419 RepID=UPI003F1E36F6
MSAAAQAAPPRAGRREWTALAVLCLPTMLLMLDMNVLVLALPHLSADLEASAVQQLWITDVYGFLIAGFLVTMGTLGDRAGRRRVLLGGAAAFAAASALAAFSTSAEMLILARAVLGLAGATVMPSTLALISDMFKDSRQRAAAVSAWATSLMVGVALGPAVGGVLLGAFWWGSVFLLAVPVMLLVLLTGPKLLPESRDPAAGRLDAVSVTLSLATVLPLVYGLKELARDGWQPLPLAALAAGAAVGTAFVLRQRKLADPMLDLRLFGDPTLRAGLLVGLLNATIMGATGLMVALYLQTVAGLSPLEAGLWLLIPATTMVIGVNLTTVLTRRLRPAHVLAAGLALAAVGQFLLTGTSGAGGIALLLTATCLIYFGTSPVGPLTTNVVLEAAPPEKAGAASALSSTGGEFGVALGIAGLGSLGASVYTARVTVPDGVDAASAEAARESIAGAVSAASAGLPPGTADELLESARAAFASGLHSVAAVSAALSLGLAVLIVLRLRNVRPSGEGHGHEPAAGGDAPQTGTPRADTAHAG